MNRRDFLKMLGIGAATVAAPKFFIDMGKNSRLYTLKGLYDHPRWESPYLTYDIPPNLIYMINTGNIAWPVQYDGYWKGDIKINPSYHGVIKL